MTKDEFLSALRHRLSVFPDEEIEKYMDYYREMIEDHVDDGYSEEQVVATLGSPDDVFAVILQETALTELLKKKMKTRRKLKKWEIWFLSLGFPIWLPLAITAFALIWVLYITLWTLVISLYVVDFSFAVGALGATAAAVALLILNCNGFAAGIAFSGALICVGLALVLFNPCILAAKGTAKLAKKIWLGIKFLIVRKEKQK